MAIFWIRSGLPLGQSERVFPLIRACREGSLPSAPSAKPDILVARVLGFRNGRSYASDPILFQASGHKWLA